MLRGNPKPRTVSASAAFRQFDAVSATSNTTEVSSFTDAFATTDKFINNNSNNINHNDTDANQNVPKSRNRRKRSMPVRGEGFTKPEEDTSPAKRRCQSFGPEVIFTVDYDEAQAGLIALDRPQLTGEDEDVVVPEGGLGDGVIDDEGLGSDGGGGEGGPSLVKRRRSRSEEEDEEDISSDDVEALESPEEGMNAEIKLEFDVDGTGSPLPSSSTMSNRELLLSVSQDKLSVIQSYEAIDLSDKNSFIYKLVSSAGYDLAKLLASICPFQGEYKGPAVNKWMNEMLEEWLSFFPNLIKHKTIIKNLFVGKNFRKARLRVLRKQGYKIDVDAQ